MPCTNNLANFPELVKPQILEENLLSPLCYSSIIPNYMLGLILYTQISIAITLTKQLLVTENGDPCRKLQLNTMQ